MHLKPKSAEVVSRKYFCDCPSYLNLDFDQFDQIDTDLVINMRDQDDLSLDLEEDEEKKLIEFVNTPSFGFLRTTNVFLPLYLVKWSRRGLLKRIYLLKNVFWEI